MNSVPIDVIVIVEGRTEQTFVRDVLAPYTAHRGIWLHPALIGKPGHKGGDVRFDRAVNDIRHFLEQRRAIHVTTMFDYFRIDSRWPGRAEVMQQVQTGAVLTASDKAEIIEAATHNEIVSIFPEYDSKNRFIPYIEMHEFEALLFSDADILAEKMEIEAAHTLGVIEQYDNPEEINDDPANAPSKRLETLKSGYRKVSMGTTIAKAMGIETIRKQCPHFDNWLTKLEVLI